MIVNKRNTAIINHKRMVESIMGGFSYVESYFVGDILPDGKIVQRKPIIRVKHNYCGKEYNVRPDVLFNKNNIKKGYECPKCCGTYQNSIHYKNPEIANMIECDEKGQAVDTKLISPYGHDKYSFKCNQCDRISDKPKRLDIVVNFNYSCYACGDGISVPEKFVGKVLEQLGVIFKREKPFEWSEKIDEIKISQLGLGIDEKVIEKLTGTKKYDFYIEDYEGKRIIIEVHGRHHYEDNSLTGRTLEEEMSNDKIKKCIAITNGQINENEYIEIDCRKSDFNYMKDSIKKELKKILDEKILDNVDYVKAYTESQKSLKLLSWELYNNGKKSSEIARDLNMSQSRIVQYLHHGAELGKSNYDAKMDRNANRIIVKLVGKTCIKEFNSLNDLYKFLGIRMEVYRKYIGENNDVIDKDFIVKKVTKNNQHTKNLIEKLKQYDGFKVIRSD
ncbi:hypothetical protein ACFCVU_26595 [Peribacillus butanolivorans]|uniref:hypothetical protein n=1 Tax=Peribacillus butanolivorans TaxID=421767 RepID=UPI0035E158A0